MALPFLPCEHIKPAFRNLEERASNDIEHQLTTYIYNTWIAGQWQPKDWCVFNQTVRTNNDVEGWHLRKNLLIVELEEVNCSLCSDRAFIKREK